MVIVEPLFFQKLLRQRRYLRASSLRKMKELYNRQFAWSGSNFLIGEQEVSSRRYQLSLSRPNNYLLA